MSSLKSKPTSKLKPNANASSAAIDSAESAVSPSPMEEISVQDPSRGDKVSDKLSFVHDAVLLQEAVAAVLGVNALPKQALPKQTGSDEQSSDRQNSLQMSGIYVDATFGRGGHSRLLLSQLADDATLIVFDKDPTAIAVAHELANIDSRVKVVHDSFATLTDSLAAMGITQVDG